MSFYIKNIAELLYCRIEIYYHKQDIYAIFLIVFDKL